MGPHTYLAGTNEEAVCISHWHHFLLVEIPVISVMLSSFRQTEVHVNLASQLLFFPLMSLHLTHCTLPRAWTTIATEYLLPPVHLQDLRCCNFYFVNTQDTCHIVMLRLQPQFMLQIRNLRSSEIDLKSCKDLVLHLVLKMISSFPNNITRDYLYSQYFAISKVHLDTVSPLTFNINQRIRRTGQSSIFKFEENCLSRERGRMWWLEVFASLGCVVTVPTNVFRSQLFSYEHGTSGKLL